MVTRYTIPDTAVDKRPRKFIHAHKIKDDKKSFFAYVRSTTKSEAQVGPLLNTQGQEMNDPGAMTDTFNEQFLSFFTVEDTTNIPVLRMCTQEMKMTG